MDVRGSVQSPPHPAGSGIAVAAQPEQQAGLSSKAAAVLAVGAVSVVAAPASVRAAAPVESGSL